VNIGNFFELQRALHRNGLQGAAAEKQGMVFFDEDFRQRLDGCIEFERLFNQARQLHQLRDQRPLFRRGRSIFCQRNGEHRERGQLRGERLGRRNADFRTCARQQHQIRFSHHRTFGDVANGERRQIRRLLGVTQRRQGVCGLA